MNDLYGLVGSLLVSALVVVWYMKSGIRYPQGAYPGALVLAHRRPAALRRLRARRRA
jgi:hypothetical protein